MQSFIYKRISSIGLRVGIFACRSFRGQHPIGEKSTKGFFKTSVDFYPFKNRDKSRIELPIFQ